MAVGFSQSGRTLQKQLSGQSGRAFLIAQDPTQRAGFQASGATSLGVRHDLGPLAMTLTGESGRIFAPFDSRPDLSSRYNRVAAAVDGKAGPLRWSLGASRLTESETLLGARFAAPLAASGSSTAFLDAEADLALGRGWTAGVLFRRGWTSTGGATLSSVGRLNSDAWAFDLSKSSLFGKDDALAFRVAQPLRVRSGGLRLSLPTSYDFATGQAGYDRQLLSLAPSGREVAYEVSYGRNLLGGFVDVHGFARSDPGHVENARRDIGAALRFTLN